MKNEIVITEYMRCTSEVLYKHLSNELHFANTTASGMYVAYSTVHVLNVEKKRKTGSFNFHTNPDALGTFFTFCSRQARRTLK